MAQHINRFEEFLGEDVPSNPPHLKRALTEVADIAYVCKLWFECYLVVADTKIAFNGADVMAMTKLVMEREAAIVAAEESESLGE